MGVGGVIKVCRKNEEIKKCYLVKLDAHIEAVPSILITISI